MKITVCKVKAKYGGDYAWYTGGTGIRPNARQILEQRIIKEFTSTLHQWSGLTATNMLVARLGMPDVLEKAGNSYMYHLQLRGRRGILRIQFNGVQTLVYVTPNMSRRTRMRLASALLYDVLYKTVPQTQGTVVQTVEGKNVFHFDKYAAIANGHFNITEVELDDEYYLREPWTYSKKEESNGKPVRDAVQR